MQHEKTLEHGAQLFGIILSGVIAEITMNKVIGIVTICGAVLYMLNQAVIFGKHIYNLIKKRK